MNETVPAPTPSDLPPIPTGTRVRIHGGPWDGASGIIDRLTESVGGAEGAVVLADLPDPTAKAAHFLPRNRLIVTERRRLERLA